MTGSGSPRPDPTDQCIVVSSEMTLLIGRGPMDLQSSPDAAIGVAFGLGAIDRPASVCVVGSSDVADLLAEDAGATRIILLVSPSALDRIEGRTRPDDGQRYGYHLPSDLRTVALAIRDSALRGEAGIIYRTAKAIELLFETWSRLDAASLVPLAASGGLSEADSLRLVNARAMIDARWNEKLSLELIARQCGLNREKLTRGFREMFACTVVEALVERRLHEASQMLLTTDLPVSLVGYENGYGNNASFSRAFGRRFGVTPSDFRARRLAA